MSKTKPKSTVFKSAASFADPDHPWIYRFPIPSVLHPRWGCIEVFLEPILKRGIIRRLYIQFCQHEIESLKGAFEIPIVAARRGTGISSHSIRGQASFFAGTWIAQPCSEHGQLIFCSYPPDDTQALVVECLSSSIGVRYELRRKR